MTSRRITAVPSPAKTTAINVLLVLSYVFLLLGLIAYWLIVYGGSGFKPYHWLALLFPMLATASAVVAALWAKSVHAMWLTIFGAAATVYVLLIFTLGSR